MLVCISRNASDRIAIQPGSFDGQPGLEEVGSLPSFLLRKWLCRRRYHSRETFFDTRINCATYWLLW
jgi:hypothetical protein